MNTLWVGTSGWQYDSWRGRFYPRDMPTTRWLAYYASRFSTVELNSSFYRLPSPRSVAGWDDLTPTDFRFAAKASRYLTHVRRLTEPEEPVSRLFDRLAPLGPRLGPVLFQLPPDLKVDPGRLDETLAECPREALVAVEARHPSWFCGEVQAVLAAHGAALCVADRRSKVQGPVWSTAEFMYCRLHEGTATPRPSYGDGAIRRWVDRIGDWIEDRTVYVYFNNDAGGCAPRNAEKLLRWAQRAGIRCGPPSITTDTSASPRPTGSRTRAASR